jgi:acetate kinase
MHVLVLNCGSSSVKFALIDPRSGENVVVGLGQRLASDQASLTFNRGGTKEEVLCAGADHARVIALVVERLGKLGLLAQVVGIGHRVVHGGAKFSASVLVDADVESRIAACNHLGPLHNPANLLGIRLGRELIPGVPQVAVFDTSFHQTMPERAYRYAVPESWYTEHDVRRYGFHGTSHRFVAQEAARLLGRREDDCQLVTAHLGNGCSAAAIRDGRSLDTTMGLTPLEGLAMGTRSGDVDPALIGYMADRMGWSAAKVIDQLNKASGLLGVSGSSNDMRTLLAAEAQGDRRAALAIDVFCYRLAKAIAGLVVALDRVDALVFTGGIGENAHPIRARTIGHLRSLGFVCDAEANAAHGRQTQQRIGSAPGRTILVVPTNEELLIARDTAALVAAH